MAKKTQLKGNNPLNIKTSKGSFGFIPAQKDLIPFIFTLLYFAVEFIPGFGGVDDMGAQWIYVVVLDFVIALYILDRKNEFEFPSIKLFKNTFSKLYLALFALAGISVFFSINHTEGWVCYVRFIATIIAFFNLSVLLYGRTQLFKIFAQLLSLIVLVQSLQSLILFFGEMHNYRLTELILAMKGRAGNKNIYAASLVAKLPFLLYCIYSFKPIGKLANTTIFLIASLTIFLVNSRTSYLGYFFQIIIYLVICIDQFIKRKDREQNLFRVGFIVVTIGMALVMSTIAISVAKSSFLDDSMDKDQYGTITERISSITSSSDGSNSERLFLWKNAADYIKQHPLMGCGYGNWKIASIPYTKYLTNDLLVPIHAHNDFLEYTAELGWLGGLLYVSLFVCLLVYSIKTWFSNAPDEVKIISGFSLIGLAAFFAEAFFNFPIERPVNQMFFVIIAAINITAFNQRGEEGTEVTEQSKTVSNLPKSAFAFTSLLFLLPSAYITYLTYQSLVVQNRVIPDLVNEPVKLPLNDVISSFPTIPNLSSSAQPIEGIIGRYLYESKKYPEAIAYLDRGAKANPYIMYSEFLKADVYFAENKMDSAYKYATLAYFTKPRAKTYYQTLIAVCSRTGDTATIKKAFKLFTRYRPNEVFGWNFYLMGMLGAKTKGNPELLGMADSAVRRFPGDKDLITRRTEIFTNMPANAVQGKVIQGSDVILSNQLFNEGNALFNQKDYAGAAQKFIRSSQISSGTYGVYENIAICYFNMKDWAKSIPYFDKVLSMKTATDGKSEYFKAAALINLGKKEEACPLLGIAKAKNYPGTDALINSYCK